MADKITQWRLVTSADSRQITAEIQKLIDSGWRPHEGHQSMLYKDDDGVPFFIFSQAMVRYEKEKPNG